MKSTKKSLLASGASLLLSAALLAGSTFAWFTDSVTNTGNVITAGNLSINAYAYDLDMTNGTQTVKIPGVYDGKEISFEAVDKGQNLKTDPQAIIDEKLWEPGKSNAKLLTVKNDGSLAAKVKVEFDVEDGGLMDALWFDFIQVKDGAATGSFQKKPMSDLAKLGSATEISVGAGGSVSFVLVYGMKEEAGNEYQDKTFSADVTVLAKQDTVEYDGFGSSDYDEDAVYDQVNVVYDEAKSARENGAALQEAVVNAKPGATLYVGAGEYDVTYNDGNTSNNHNLLITKDNVTIIGTEGTIISSKYTSGMGDAQQTIMIKGDNVTLKNLTIMPVEGYNNKTVEIMGAKNTVIENCKIDGNLYIGDPATGAYTVKNNTFVNDDVSIVVANGAGNAMANGEKAIISGNDCSGALYLTGTRNTGWDNNELTQLPEITGNTFGSYTQTVNGTEYTHYIRIASTVKENLDKISVENIKTNNTFEGKADDWTSTDVEDTTDYSGTWYRFFK